MYMPITRVNREQEVEKCYEVTALPGLRWRHRSADADFLPAEHFFATCTLGVVNQSSNKSRGTQKIPLP